MRKKILVTGAAGFLGSNLCKKLLLEKDFVIGVDNFSTGQIQNIDQLSKSKSFDFLELDICDQKILKINMKIDQIYNLACPASPVHYQTDPVQTLKSCSTGVLNILELAKSNNATFLQASTSEVYGDPKINPQTESYWGNVNPIGPRSCYDEGKRFAESLILNFGIPYRIVRIFNTYGPGMAKNDGRVVSNFILQALLSLPITIFGDGLQTRSLCFVDDLIEGLTRAMNHKEKLLGPINLGSTNQITIKELALLIKNLANSKSEIVYKPLPIDDPVLRCPDISKAKKMLKWQPTTDLKSGLEQTIRFFKSHKELIRHLSC